MCNQLITEATRETQSTKNILDVILSTVPDSHTKSGALKCGLSDYNFVYTVMGGRHSESQTRIVAFRKHKDFDAEKFKENLRDKMHTLSVNSYSNIEESWTAFKEVFERVCNKPAPLCKSKLRNRYHGYNPWITSDIVKSMHERDYIHRRAGDLKSDVLMANYGTLRKVVP